MRIQFSLTQLLALSLAWIVLLGAGGALVMSPLLFDEFMQILSPLLVINGLALAARLVYIWSANPRIGLSILLGVLALGAPIMWAGSDDQLFVGYLFAAGSLVVLANIWGVYLFRNRRRQFDSAAIVGSITVAAVLAISCWYLPAEEMETLLFLLSFAGAINVIGWIAYLAFSRRAVTLSLPRTATTFFQIAGGCLLVLLMEFGAYQVNIPFGNLIDMTIWLLNGWAVYAFLRYRQTRQSELVQILAAAAQRNVPLDVAVRAFRADSPKRGVLWQYLTFATYVFLPLYAYTRLCIGIRGYDRLLDQLAKRLEQGESLSGAFTAAPGVSSRQARILAAVGEKTGALDACLRAADREPGSALWLELAPRFAYPMLLFLFLSAIFSFLMIFIMPRYRRMFDEFNVAMPRVTIELASFWESVFSFGQGATVGTLLFLLCASVSVIIANPTTRWWTPLFGRLYRWSVQSTILRSLGRLLAAGQTAPEALAFLNTAAAYPTVVERRIRAAKRDIMAGEPLDLALVEAGLLPRSMRAFVHSAQQARNLPWALMEMADQLSTRGFRLIQRMSLIVTPIMVVILGTLVAIVALGMFVPLIRLMAELGK